MSKKRYHIMLNEDLQNKLASIQRSMSADTVTEVMKAAINALYLIQAKTSKYAPGAIAAKEKVKRDKMTPTQRFADALRKGEDPQMVCQVEYNGWVTENLDKPGSYRCAFPPFGNESWEMPEDWKPEGSELMERSL